MNWKIYLFVEPNYFGGEDEIFHPDIVKYSLKNY